MTSTVVITVVVAVAIVWLAVVAVNTLRSRGNEEIPANLAPGAPDEVMETKRLERTQQAAVLVSAFLALALPLYYAGEPARQEQFIDDFSVQDIERGHEHYLEFGCGGCHAPDGSGGSAKYVEKRSGVTVSWEAPSINDVFYRFPREQVIYWLTYGRANTPMPAWGLAGGGPMNEQQIEELADYLQSEEFAISPGAVAAEVDPTVTAQLNRLEGASAAIETAIVQQRQIVADLERAPEIKDAVEALDARAADLLENIDVGVDTDGDGVADAVEEEVNGIQRDLIDALLIPGVESITFDPANPQSTGAPDADVAARLVDTYRTLAGDGTAPILGPIADQIESIIAGSGAESGQDAGAETDSMDAEAGMEESPDTTADPGDSGDSTDAADTDGDGLTDQAEQQITGQVTQAVDALLPSGYSTVELDPANPESNGSPDLSAADTALNAIRTVATNVRLNVDNGPDKLIPSATASLESLEQARDNAHWEFDYETIADESFSGDVEAARRTVGIFQGYCARCHTSGYSAGLPLIQEPGSGGFGPALWDGRPGVQFLDTESMVEFLKVGAVANQPYGVNGFGNGQMPAFGTILSEDDLTNLATWLRTGNLDGQEGD